MTAQPQYASLIEALAAIQSKIPIVQKGETATVPTKAGGQYSYSYADLAAVASTVYPILGPAGLAFLAAPTYTEHDRYVLRGTLAHVSGQERSGDFPLPDNAGPQALGSAITYGRRYLLCALTGTITGDEDDDGRTAQDNWHGRDQEPASTVESDAQWVSEFEKKIDLADSNTAVATLRGELNVAVKAKRLHPTDANRLLGRLDERRKELTAA